MTVILFFRRALTDVRLPPLTWVDDIVVQLVPPVFPLCWVVDHPEGAHRPPRGVQAVDGDRTARRGPCERRCANGA